MATAKVAAADGDEDLRKTNAPTNPNGTKKFNLFEFSEEELLEEHVLTHYEILSLPVHASQMDVKKAYRKTSLKYHPDKTGRGEDDYVFLAVKAAYDCLFDAAKRQGYDSTVLPFDDTIPASRSALLQNEFLMYKDEDFYQTFGPVFVLNLRFDAQLRPEAAKNGAKNSSNKNGKHSNNNKKKPKAPPSLGDADTPLEQVHEFYEYWIHFDSWRDFSQTATDELQVENELENAESRYEKRWLQKEIDKRAKALKKKEMARIQTLVERAMEADPRLRKEREDAVAAKLRKEQERKEREKQKLLDAKKQKENEAAAVEREKQRKAEEKIEREKAKKLQRKARQSLRKLASSTFERQKSFNSTQLHWNDAYDMNQDVDLLCTSLTTDSIKELTESFESSSIDATVTSSSPNHESDCALLSRIKDRADDLRREQEEEEEKKQRERQLQKEKNASEAAQAKAVPWTKEELAALAKASRKYPAGSGASRWDMVAGMVNQVCKYANNRTKEECVSKYNQVQRGMGRFENNSTINPSSETAKTATTSSASVATPSQPTVAATEEEEWTDSQIEQLKAALKRYPATMEKNERWKSISAAVSGKNKKQCVQQFKAIRAALQNSKKKQ